MHRIQLESEHGFTLMQLVVVLIGLALLASMAVEIVSGSIEQARKNMAEAEMNRIVQAILGDKDLRSEAWRTDYGYVGDVGSLPSSLDQLVASNACGWNGPYIDVNYQQAPDDWKTDPWGTEYTYDPVNMVLQSTGGPEVVTKQIAKSRNFILQNSFSVQIKNYNGTPFTDDMGAVYVVVNPCQNIAFTHQDDQEGTWTVSNVPQGRRDFFIVTGGDTSYYAVNVEPGRPVPFREYTIFPDFGVIEYVGGSAALSGIDNSNLGFTVKNVGDPTFYVNRIRVSWENNEYCWGELTPYLERIISGTDTLWSASNQGGGQRAESGMSFGIDPPLEFATGEFDFDDLKFRSTKTGTGYPVDMNGTRIVMVFYLKNAGSQTVDFLTSPTECTPGNIQYADSLTTEAGSDTSRLAFLLKNTGDLKVYLDRVKTSWTNPTDAFLDRLTMNGTTLFEFSTHRLASGDILPLSSDLVIPPGFSSVDHLDFKDMANAASPAAGPANMSRDTIEIVYYTIKSDSYLVRIPVDSSQFH